MDSIASFIITKSRINECAYSTELTYFETARPMHSLFLFRIDCWYPCAGDHEPVQPAKYRNTTLQYTYISMKIAYLCIGN